MNPSPHALRNLLCSRFVMMLAVGVLVSTASGGATAKNVDVTVVAVKVASATSPPPPPYNASPWVCRGDAQPGPSSTWYVICVNPDPVTTDEDPDRKVKITWTLSSSGSWKFPAYGGGIDIKKGASWKIKPGATTYTGDSMKDGNQYSYTVNLINAGYVLTWDPTIMN